MTVYRIIVGNEVQATADEIDEAQQEAADLVAELCQAYYRGRDWTGRKATVNALLDAAFNVPDEGGTVGPLPGGELIVVERAEP